jgi:hypothetical protein
MLPHTLPVLLPRRQRVRPADLVQFFAWELETEEIVGWILQSSVVSYINSNLL